ncbi:hypothetical protein PSTG_19243 [Puccinia striiformis f. sp. tritici PST-78]|uniref:Uncharacterized protein n=1 Tax=Puccinia striiformis f. sp. tritici PST-78 TaxID=1165861 RepID=A0A0L0UJV0_9BASI|nr:hypothetical protein PSTG_19243 [Puccinia striiformis f. sp. tritici PST-78]
MSPLPTNANDPDSSTSFDNVALTLGPISGGHDLILGTPFLSQFCLSLPISDQSIYCNASNIISHRDRLPVRIEGERVPSRVSGPFPA